MCTCRTGDRPLRTRTQCTPPRPPCRRPGAPPVHPGSPPWPGGPAPLGAQRGGTRPGAGTPGIPQTPLQGVQSGVHMQSSKVAEQGVCRGTPHSLSLALARQHWPVSSLCANPDSLEVAARPFEAQRLGFRVGWAYVGGSEWIDRRSREPLVRRVQGSGSLPGGLLSESSPWHSELQVQAC